MIPEPPANGFCFGEGPRRFAGLLWFSDMPGEAVHTADTHAVAIACALGGPARRTLFLLSSTDAYLQHLVGTRLSRLDAVLVSTPGAGLP